MTRYKSKDNFLITSLSIADSLSQTAQDDFACFSDLSRWHRAMFHTRRRRQFLRQTPPPHAEAAEAAETAATAQVAVTKDQLLGEERL